MNDAELDRLLSDFSSGRNKRSFLPLSQEYRRRKDFSRALEICKQGLMQDRSSVSGHIMQARLLNDLGRHGEAWREIEKTSTMLLDPPIGMLEEKARCQIHLNRLEEARETVEQLTAIEPMAASIQVLRSELRSQTYHNDQPAASQVSVKKMSFLGPKEILSRIENDIKPLTRTLILDFFDTQSSKFTVREKDILLEHAIDLHEEVSRSSMDMGYGDLKYTTLELNQAQFFVVSRERYILFAALSPDANIGKIQHRVFLILDRHLPLNSK